MQSVAAQLNSNSIGNPYVNLFRFVLFYFILLLFDDLEILLKRT